MKRHGAVLVFKKGLSPSKIAEVIGKPATKRKMKRGGGARKGSAYERKLCKHLSLWASHGEDENYFWRTSGSGSRATNRQRLGAKTSKFDFGDMKHECPDGRPFTEHLCWEFRSRSHFDLIAVFGDGNEDPDYSLLSSWAKACDEADKSGRRPILITNAVRRPEVFWMRWAFYFELSLTGDNGLCGMNRIEFEIQPSMTVRYDKKKTYTFKARDVVIGVPLNDFLTAIDPEVFLSCLNAYMRMPR